MVSMATSNDTDLRRLVALGPFTSDRWFVIKGDGDSICEAHGALADDIDGGEMARLIATALNSDSGVLHNEIGRLQRYERAFYAHWARQSHEQSCGRCRPEDSSFCDEGQRLHDEDIAAFTAVLRAPKGAVAS